MVAVKRSGLGHGEICPESDPIEGRGATQATRSDKPTLIVPDAPRSAPIPTGARGDATRGAAGTAGFMHRVGDFFRRHRPSVAAAMVGALMLPALGAALPTTASADPISNRAAVVDTVDRTSPPVVHRTTHRFVHQVTNPFSGIAKPEAKFELLQVKAGALEDAAASTTPEALARAREQLYQDYLAGGGTIGVARGIPPNEMLAHKIAFAQPTRDISTRNVTDFALFKYFWETESQAGVGLARHGLDEVTPDGVKKLADYAKTHDVDGKEKPAALQRIDPDQRAVMRAIMEHPRYGQYFEVYARPLLYKAFGLDTKNVKVPPDTIRPQKAGDISIPHATNRGEQIALGPIANLPQMMTAEYNARKDYFEDPSVSVETRGLRTLGLLKDYATAMWGRGERPETENTGYALLDEFTKMPYAAVFGTKDYNGAGFSVAQSLILGIDENKLETRFPNASLDAPNTYFSLDGSMAKPMSLVDRYLAAAGKQGGAEAFEKKSPLGWMIGQESGHTKAGNLNEQKPFSSSGLNWGILLFPGDRQIENLPPKAGFEFPIDCIDGFGNAITARADWGDRMEVRDAEGHKLKVVKKIEKDHGKPVSWYAEFQDARGHKVDPSKVLGVILNASGQVKGDGQASRELNMWWWGFCDRNTAQRLYKSMYGIPQIDRDVKITVNGKTIVFPKEDAQKIVDMDVPNLVPYETMSGFRFNDNPQTVKLKDGSVFQARVRDLAMDAGPGVDRIGGDLIAIHDAPGRPMLGTLELQEKDTTGKPFGVDVRYVDRVTDNADGTVTIKMNDDYDGYRKEVTGKLLTAVKWEKAQTIDGKKVLVQNDDDYPIRGGFTLDLLNGQTRRVNASEVSQITGETMHDVRISQFTKWVIDNKGIFATDGDPGVVVSNGARIVNRIDITQSFDDTRPEWAANKSKLLGIRGYLTREPGDKIEWWNALYGSKGEEPTTPLYQGWVQVSKDGRILNEGFTSGQPDFGWAGSGKLDWSARSSFNPYMDPELRLKIFVNGVSDQSKLEKLAADGNLPSNWRTYVAPQ